MEKYIAKNGKIFTVRQPTENSARNIVDYLKILLASTDQTVTAYKEFTISLAEEKAFIKSLDRNPNSLLLIAEIDNQLVGYLEFMPNPKMKSSHTGDFTVNVHPDFQNNGIGTMLIKTLLSWSKLNYTIEKVCLNVLVTNVRAIKLFKELGFVEEGRQIKAVKQLTGEYVDVLQMYVWAK